MARALALLAVAGVALGAPAEDAHYGGWIYLDARTGVQSAHASGAELGQTVWDNTSHGVNMSYSSTNLSTVWGDDFVGAGTGVIEEFTFGLLNSLGEGNTGALQTATMAIRFYEDRAAIALPSSGGLLGGFNGTVNFGAGLPAGHYVLVTVTGLSGLGINLQDANNAFTQQVTAKTGPTTSLGIISLGTPTIGSGFPDFYRNPGPSGAGWYTFRTTVLNLANKIVVVPAPGAAVLFGLGGLVACRRRSLQLAREPAAR